MRLKQTVEDGVREDAARAWIPPREEERAMGAKDEERARAWAESFLCGMRSPVASDMDALKGAGVTAWLAHAFEEGRREERERAAKDVPCRICAHSLGVHAKGCPERRRSATPEPSAATCGHGDGVPLGPRGTCLFCERDASRTMSQADRRSRDGAVENLAAHLTPEPAADRDAELSALRRVAEAARAEADDLEASLAIGREYHGANKHSSDWHDGFESCAKASLGPLRDALAALDAANGGGT